MSEFCNLKCKRETRVQINWPLQGPKSPVAPPHLAQPSNTPSQRRSSTPPQKRNTHPGPRTRRAPSRPTNLLLAVAPHKVSLLSQNGQSEGRPRFICVPSEPFVAQMKREGSPGHKIIFFLSDAFVSRIHPISSPAANANDKVTKGLGPRRATELPAELIARPTQAQ